MKGQPQLPRDIIGKLSQKSSDQLYAFAVSLTKDNTDAEDLYQDTLLLALKNSDKFREGTNFLAWMKTIMRNSFINGYRRRKRFLAYVNEKSSKIQLEKPKADNLAETTIFINEISEIIDKIDERFSQPFKMYYKGYSYDEIAEELELPLGTVKSRIFIARRRIREEYKRRFDGPPYFYQAKVG